MSFISTHFVFNGVKSEDMGIHLIKMSSGFIERQFFGEREIISELVIGNDTPYIFGKRTQPFKVKMQLSPLEGKWTSELKTSVSAWLNNGKFNEFFSTDDISRRYFLTYIGSPSLSLTGIEQGYIDVEFLNIDCYVRSPMEEEIFDLSNIATPTIITVKNLGNTVIYPNDMWIEKIGTGDISIKNLTDGGRIFKFTGLQNNEIVYIKNKDRHIETSIPDTYRYDSFNGNYLRIVYGVNRFEVTGTCKLKLRYRHEFSSQ